MYKKPFFLFTFTIFLGGIFFVWDALAPIGNTSESTYGSLIIYDAWWRLITQKWRSDGYMQNYTWDLDGRIFDAIIEVEDKRYEQHFGIDIWAKSAWIMENIRAWAIVRGGSTLTEQYIKNTYYRGKPRTIRQKIREAIAALYIESTQPKDEILRNYLDNIYFGNRIYGLQTALDTYFGGKSIDTLTDDDILDIITRIHSPNISESNRESVLTYRADVAHRLWWTVWETTLFAPVTPRYIDTYPIVTARIMRAIEWYCRYGEWELEKWTQEIPTDICTPGKQVLHTTLIGALQEYGLDIIQKTLQSIEKENVTGAAIYIYHPIEKKILAYIGNRWVYESEKSIDMIVRKRSVGSILKPFIYLMALRKWAELDTLILDDTRIYPTGIEGRGFIPQNYNPKSYGPVRLREALGNSLNSATVRISESLGIGRIYDFFVHVGIDMDHDAGYYGYGISLGTVEASLANIVESYGYLTQTWDIDIFLIKKALAEKKNRSKTFGISSILNSSLDLPVKTGTSTDFRDNWAISYHRDAIIWVWVGNADGSAMGDISWVTGAGPIWHTLAEYMISTGLIRPYREDTPDGVSETLICLDTHCLQRERTYMKNPDSIESRILSKSYRIQDFFGVITEEEKRKWNIEEFSLHNSENM